MRVLLVYRALFRDRDEALEVRELIAGVAESIPSNAVVEVTNGRERFVPRGRDLEPLGPLRLREARYDVAHVHLALPVAHLLLALALRLRGARIVLTPMAMLGDDFASGSWFRPVSPVRRALKPMAVRLQRMLWCWIARSFVCASREEIVQAHLPAERCLLVPLAVPDSPLAAAAARAALPGERAPDGPVAFTTRFDVHRKGIDRLCRWLDKRRDVLPRPAVLLLAPSDDPVPPNLGQLIADGVLEWDSSTRGADLLPRLAGCRGQMLLSRYDGQPRVLREAAVLGLPTLSTRASHFAEAVAALGTGAIVDGDDLDDITAAYSSLPGQPRNAEAARRLFSRGRIGAYLWNAYGGIALAESSAPRSYYDEVAEGGEGS
ncbi:MAG: glycosyltransferase [Actinobacteria bacterium]|nr:glycosyltransferase [Actinomycetota bacterium]